MNKTHMTNYCKQLLKNIRGYILNDYETEIIKILLKSHPESKQKIGCGVDNIFIGKGLYGSSCFNIKRVNGTQTDFSYHACLNPPTQKSQFRKACREAVQYDIDKYLDEKSDGINFICEISGEQLRREDCHVDHYGEYKFSDIVKKFIQEFNIDINNIKFNETKNGCMHTLFLEKELEIKFREFHKKYAKLRVINEKLHKETIHGK